MLNAILEVGAIARFADVTDDLTLDPAALAALVTPRTRAVLPVHLYGLPAAMGEISAVARQPAVRADSSPPATMRSRPGSAWLDRDQLAPCLDAGASTPSRTTRSWSTNTLLLRARRS